VKENGIHSKFKGTSLAKNSIYNLIGFGIPLIAAVLLLPFLIHGLGDERFGILGIAWVVLGYFSLFDLGIGRSVTKLIAEKIGSNESEQIPPLFWTAFSLIFFVSTSVACGLFFLVPSFVYNLFKVSNDLKIETLQSFYLIVFSIPIVATSASIRGVLEAYQEFGVISFIRVLLGISSFVVPVFCLFVTQNLVWIILSLVVFRIIIWILYLYQCFKINPALKSTRNFDRGLIKPIIRLGGWMSISSIVVPLNLYLDRFMIGTLVSASAIAYYVTPYEITSKLLIIPSAFAGVLFPAISAMHRRDSEYSNKLIIRATKYIFLILYPIVFFIVMFAQDGMVFWIGRQFAENSYMILKILALGALFNSIGYVPFAFLDGIGRSDITAKVQLIELPFYFLLMWFSIKVGGINGAACAWGFRTAVDSAILWFFAQKLNSNKIALRIKSIHLWIILLIFFLSVVFIIEGNTYYKILMSIVVISVFSLVSWHSLLQKEERDFIISKLEIFTR
jgi:O-antigen/teichoic acid export membrane protein